MSDGHVIIRIKLFAAVVLVVFLIMLGRMWHLQVVSYESFDRAARINRTRILPIDAPRGLIMDRNGNVLVTSRMASVVSIIPQHLKDRDDIVGKLSLLLNLSTDEIENIILQQIGSPFKPIRIALDVPVETIVSIEERRNELPGVIIEKIPVRQYIENSLASLIIGRMGRAQDSDVRRLGPDDYRAGDIIGATGIEYVYEAFLRGIDGKQEVEVNTHDWPVGVVGQEAPVPGYDLVLSIDRDLQRVAENALRDRIDYLINETEYVNAQTGAVVVMEVKTGDVLAIVSYPDYDPNNFVGGISSANWNKLAQDPRSPLFNRPIKGRYSPGSTFKIFTAIAALENNFVYKDEIFHSAGKDPVIPSFTCWYYNLTGTGHGDIDLVEAMAVSCNIVFYELARRAGIDEVAHFARAYGLGRTTGIEEAFEERAGIVPDREWKQNEKNTPWYPGDTLNVSIGQGDLLVTPLQMAKAYTAFASGGQVMAPRFVREILSPTGEVIQEFPVDVESVINISGQTQELILEGLIHVTLPGGTAYSAFQDFPLTVAGKTGTAEVARRDSHGWFAGFAPAYDPEIVVVTLIEHGGGGSNAAPVAREILEYYFREKEEGGSN